MQGSCIESAGTLEGCRLGQCLLGAEACQGAGLDIPGERISQQQESLLGWGGGTT